MGQRWRKTAPLARLGMPEDVADACLSRLARRPLDHRHHAARRWRRDDTSDILRGSHVNRLRRSQ